MKIDWKEISKSPGYKSLKKAYIRDIQKNWRSKEESYAKFMKVLGYAKQHAIKTGRSISELLTEWEEKRTDWWLNYYEDFSFKIIPQRRFKYIRPPKNEVGRKDTSKKERWAFDRHRKNRARMAAFARQQQTKSVS